MNNISIEKNHLFFQFGISIFVLLLEQAEVTFPNDDRYVEEWSNFIDTVMKLIGATTCNVAPYVPIIACTLYQHLNRFRKLDTEKFSSLERLLTRIDISP